MIQYLKQLLSACGPSVCEYDAVTIFRDRVADVATLRYDNMGNTVATVGEGKYNVLLSAHIDEIGFQITGYRKDGLLKIRKIGGVKKHYLIQQPVVLLTPNGKVNGLLVSKSPQGDKEELPDFDATYIDIDAADAEEAKKVVPLGCYATYLPNCEINGDIVTSKSLDDRIGIYTISEVMMRLAGKLQNVRLSVSANVQEELGLRGMASVSQLEHPDVCINFDVVDAHQLDKETTAVLGGGAVLYLNADSNPLLRSTLEEIAEKGDIPIQQSLGRNITGGTDASRIQLFSPSTAVAGIGLPCKYMHAPHEKCSLRDVESAIDLTVSFLLDIDRRLAAGERPSFTF